MGCEDQYDLTPDTVFGVADGVAEQGDGHAHECVYTSLEEDGDDVGQVLACLVGLDEFVFGGAGVGPSEEPIGADDHSG